MTYTEEIITVGHRPFSGQSLHMTDHDHLWSEGKWPTTFLLTQFITVRHLTKVRQND